MFGPECVQREKSNKDFTRNAGQTTEQLPLPHMPAVCEDEWLLVNCIFTGTVT